MTEGEWKQIWQVKYWKERCEVLEKIVKEELCIDDISELGELDLTPTHLCPDPKLEPEKFKKYIADLGIKHSILKDFGNFSDE